MKYIKIAKRVKGGWTERQSNKQKYVCDDCGKQLFVAPDGKTVYCDNESELHHD